MSGMGRREFIALLGGAAAWPVAARAQQGERYAAHRRAHGSQPDDPEGRPASRRFWRGCRNWAGPSAVTRVSTRAGRPACRGPQIFGRTGRACSGRAPRNRQREPGRFLESTRTVPIVFVNVGDPVGGGFVESLARPSGNATGFSFTEYGVSAKWLELLKEIAPGLREWPYCAILATSGSGQFGAIQAVAPSFGVELNPIDVRDASDIERAIAAFVRSPRPV